MGAFIRCIGCLLCTRTCSQRLVGHNTDAVEVDRPTFRRPGLDCWIQRLNTTLIRLWLRCGNGRWMAPVLALVVGCVRSRQDIHAVRCPHNRQHKRTNVPPSQRPHLPTPMRHDDNDEWLADWLTTRHLTRSTYLGGVSLSLFVWVCMWVVSKAARECGKQQGAQTAWEIPH